MSFDLYQLVQILYWIALATAFGGVLFVALAAPVIFRTVGDANPVMPSVLSVNLEGQHGTLLAGTIVGNLLAMLGRVQFICGIVLMICIIAQLFLIDLVAGNRTAMIIRILMFIAAAAVVAYDRLILWPRILQHRQRYLDNADEPDIANPAKEQFDHDHRRSVTLLSAVLFLLLGMILFSANISPRPTARPDVAAVDRPAQADQLAHSAGNAKPTVHQLDDPQFD